jgi:hypothetical protein
MAIQLSVAVNQRVVMPQEKHKMRKTSDVIGAKLAKPQSGLALNKQKRKNP